jgi:hypothetical protein
VSAGKVHTCAVDVNGCAACWGRDRADDTELPEDWDVCSVAAVDAGGDQTCFLARTGALECSGGLYGDEPSGPWNPDGPYLDASAGTTLACALDQSGEAHCDDPRSFGCPLEETAASMAIDVAYSARCVILSGGATSCWGAGYPDADGGDPTCRRGDAARVFGR